MRANAESEKEDAANTGRPVIVSIVSAVIFLLGSVGFVLGVIAGVGALLLRASLSGFHVLVIMFWFVLGPCLILAGYNLWKRRKWAAQLAAGIIVFDLITAVVSGHVDTSLLDVITLAGIGFAWKHLQ